MKDLKIIENELVPVYTTSTNEKVVMGRELWEKLQSKTKFSTWILRRLDECDAQENIDYQPTQIWEGSTMPVTANAKEYIIKLDTAKEMAMLERNDIGKQVRKYFIEIEKKYKTESQKLTGSKLIALGLIEAQKMIEEKDKIIESQKPAVLFAESVSASSTSILVGEMAKILNQNGIDTGEKRLYEWLRENGYLIKRRGTDWNMPTQKSIEMNLFEISETTINHNSGKISIRKTTKVTGKGQRYFIDKFVKSESKQLSIIDGGLSI